MKIKGTKGFVFISEAVKHKLGIKFDYDKCKNRDLLKRGRSGIVYLICSNKEIMKIGLTQSKSGLRSAINSYADSYKGGPSKRSVGVRMYILKELKKGKKVEIFAKPSPETQITIKDLFGESREISAYSSYEFGDVCKGNYRDREEKYPPWNLQDNKEKWPEKVIREWRRVNSKNSGGSYI